MLPPLVRRALELEAELGSEPSCAPELGALLHVLAAERGRTRVAEAGTGAGAAWLVSALPPAVPVFTAVLDEGRAEAARRLFADDPEVRVLTGDWRQTLPAEAPFDLLVLGPAGRLRPPEGDELAPDLLAPGGVAVLLEPLPPARSFWLAHPDLSATEVLTGGGAAAILAVRR